MDSVGTLEHASDFSHLVFDSKEVTYRYIVKKCLFSLVESGGHVLEPFVSGLEVLFLKQFEVGRFEVEERRGERRFYLLEVEHAVNTGVCFDNDFALELVECFAFESLFVFSLDGEEVLFQVLEDDVDYLVFVIGVAVVLD